MVIQALNQDLEEPLLYLQNHLPQALAEIMKMDFPEETYPNWRFQPNAPILEALLGQFIRLRRIRVNESLDQIVFLQTHGEALDEETSLQIRQTALEYVKARSNLDKALRQPFSQK